MTPTEQRIAIAEACGWFKYCVNSLKEQVWHKKIESKYADTAVAGLEDLPDYVNDLNAMHEAEKIITRWRLYSDHLKRIVQDSDINLYNDAVGARYRTAHATAAQRAEAFLRTIGKWKD